MKETRFKRGEKVRIKSCPICENVVGAKATVVRVITDKNGASLYKVRVGSFYVPQYALDEHLEKLTK